MAKSLRSKWKRKMRAVKRERYEQKELVRLNDMLTKAGEISKEVKSENEDEEVQEMAVENKEKSINVDVVKSFPRKIRVPRRVSRLRNEKEKETIPATIIDGEEDVEKMNVDTLERIFNKRTMRDQFGNYPDWMSKKKVRTQQKKNKRLKKKALKLKNK